MLKRDRRSSGFFKNVRPVRQKIEVAGRVHEIELPQRYYDWEFMMAHFPASASGLRAALPSAKLAPVEIVPGLGVLSVAAFEYRRAEDLAPYNEVAVMTPVRLQPGVNLPALPLLFPDWFADLGFYIFHLPVTTQQSCDVGVGFWNFPKTVADIAFDEDAATRTCRWRADGADVLALTVSKAATRDVSINFTAYPVKDGDILTTLVQTHGRYFITNLPGGARLALGDHAVASRLRGLRPWRLAIGRTYATGAESLLNAASARTPA
jgi:hypothetical protein